jgi:hypothetical protein
VDFFRPRTPETHGDAVPFKPQKIADTLRTLRGRNRALLVRTDDGRHFVQKFRGNANNSDLLFNEAFASQLGRALDLSFPAWSELIDDDASSGQSSFGSELIPGDILECLPGGWYRNVENGSDAYRCLLFDLWCSHADSRQAAFQTRSPRVFHAYFFDHDQMFSLDDGAPVPKRIARARCLDLRVYKQPFGSIIHNLRKLADRIRLLARHELRNLENTVPATWGSIAHREQAISGLERRSDHLNSYIEEIAHFASGIG